MTDNRKTTVPSASVGADAVQSSSKINTNIITNSDEQINLQAAKKSNNFGLNTVSMTELYDTVYPPRKPIVNDLLYSGTYLFVGAPKVGKSLNAACGSSKEPKRNSGSCRPTRFWKRWQRCSARNSQSGAVRPRSCWNVCRV